MKKIIPVMLFVMLALFSCEKKKTEPVFMASNGRMNHLLLVVEHSQWQTEIGKKIREIITSPVTGLPQEENQFGISQIPHQSFGKMFKSSRNILDIEIGYQKAFQAKRNVFAKPQQIVKITAPTQEDMVVALEEYKNKIIKTFKDFDIENLQYSHRKEAYKPEIFQTLTNLNLEMQIPKFFRLVEDTGDFLWFRQWLSGGLTPGDNNSNILVYSFPIPENTSDLVQSISQMRDSIGKKHMPGMKENMYMITEKAFTPILSEVMIASKKAYKTVGKWEVFNDFMAGPFVNYVIEDTPNNRWIVLEGFTYAPSVNKRDYQFELDAVLKSIVFKE